MSAATGRTRLSGPFVPEKSDWPEGVYLIQPDDPVLGGEDGPDNWPLISLAHRTLWLRAQIEAVLAAAGLTLETASTSQLQEAIARLIAVAVEGIPRPGAATETVAGLVTLASLAVAKAGTSTDHVVTPAGLAAVVALLAPLASPALTGTPTAPTAPAGTSSSQIATTAFVAAAVQALVNAAPGALDTLAELATALGNDANFATTITNALALKAPLASPALTGTPTAPTAAAGTATPQLATTAFVQAALVALGIEAYARLNAAQTWTKPQSCAVVPLTDAASIAWDLSAGQMAEVTIAASRTLAAPTNQAAGTMYQLRVIHGAASTSLAFAAAYTGVSSLVMSTKASAVDVLTFRSNGTTLELVGVALAVGA